MERVTRIASHTVVLRADDVDTDQIVPARFLKGTTRGGLAAALFADWRYGDDGQPRADFALNRPEAEGAQVLVAGSNFGCGSSREHAVWALQGHGFRAVVAASFADIFRRNALKNGLLAVALEGPAHARLCREPGLAVAIDLASQTLTSADGTVASFSLDPFARRCLLSGLDELAFLLEQDEAITAFEGRRPGWRVVV